MNSEDKKTEKSSTKQPWQSSNYLKDSNIREDRMRVWGILLFGFIGATVTTFAIQQLRRTYNLLYTQLNRSQSYSSWKGASGTSNHSSFNEEAWKRYNRRIQEEYEEEMERVERIRRMQRAFNRERNKFKRSYDGWREYGPGAYQYQHFQHDDWYWNSDTSYKDQWTNSRTTPRDSGNYPLSHHYSVLGLDRSRVKPYSDAEIKTAFRAKAKQHHPDQNQDNKEASEAKFKEVMMSYEAIKLERKNRNYGFE